MGDLQPSTLFRRKPVSARPAPSNAATDYSGGGKKRSAGSRGVRLSNPDRTTNRRWHALPLRASGSLRSWGQPTLTCAGRAESCVTRIHLRDAWHGQYDTAATVACAHCRRPRGAPCRVTVRDAGPARLGANARPRDPHSLPTWSLGKEEACISGPVPGSVNGRSRSQPG